MTVERPVQSASPDCAAGPASPAAVNRPIWTGTATPPAMTATAALVYFSSASVDRSYATFVAMKPAKRSHGGAVSPEQLQKQRAASPSQPPSSDGATSGDPGSGMNTVTMRAAPATISNSAYAQRATHPVTHTRTDSQ